MDVRGQFSPPSRDNPLPQYYTDKLKSMWWIYTTHGIWRYPWSATHIHFCPKQLLSFEWCSGASIHHRQPFKKNIMHIIKILKHATQKSCSFFPSHFQFDASIHLPSPPLLLTFSYSVLVSFTLFPYLFCILYWIWFSCRSFFFQVVSFGLGILFFIRLKVLCSKFAFGFIQRSESNETHEPLYLSVNALHGKNKKKNNNNEI